MTRQLSPPLIEELSRRLGWNDARRSRILLEIVLHALRDNLELDEAIDLGNKLPLPLRTIYIEGWRPRTTHAGGWSIDDLLNQINFFFRYDMLADPAKAVITVFKFLAGKVAEGEIEDAKHLVPKAMRGIWQTLHNPRRTRH